MLVLVIGFEKSVVLTDIFRVMVNNLFLKKIIGKKKINVLLIIVLTVLVSMTLEKKKYFKKLLCM